eukprot:9409048-Pyramimonas_sp.AAC.1
MTCNGCCTDVCIKLACVPKLGGILGLSWGSLGPLLGHLGGVLGASGTLLGRLEALLGLFWG